ILVEAFLGAFARVDGTTHRGRRKRFRLAGSRHWSCPFVVSLKKKCPEQCRRITAFLPPARVDRRGIAPRFPLCDGGVFLLDEQPQEVRPGIEPGLPRLPGRRAAATLPDQSVAEAGFEPAWERLMRPCWCLTPVHSAVPPAGLEPAVIASL